MCDDTKAVFNIYFEDMVILEIYNSDNDTDSLFFRIT